MYVNKDMKVAANDDVYTICQAEASYKSTYDMNRKTSITIEGIKKKRHR